MNQPTITTVSKSPVRTKIVQPPYGRDTYETIVANQDFGLLAKAFANSLELLRKTAPNPIAEFEYYVTLLVRIYGLPSEQAARRNASGVVVKERTIAVSVFHRTAIQRAQSICSELLSLRPFLWLYRDEEMARLKNDEETIRKFGPEVSRRIARFPVYGLNSLPISELTRGGPRPAAEIREIFVQLLRSRGLPYLAEKLKDHLQIGRAHV